MDIEKLKQDLIEKAKTFERDFTSFCRNNNCKKCELTTLELDCPETIMFIALCDAYALGANNQSDSNNIAKLLKELFPNFYEHLTKKEIE